MLERAVQSQGKARAEPGETLGEQPTESKRLWRRSAVGVLYSGNAALQRDPGQVGSDAPSFLRAYAGSTLFADGAHQPGNWTLGDLASMRDMGSPDCFAALENCLRHAKAAAEGKVRKGEL